MIDLPGIAIDRSLRVRSGQFIDQTQAKSLIVVHHTADGSPQSVVCTGGTQDPKRIATAIVIDRDGTVYETFDPTSGLTTPAPAAASTAAPSASSSPTGASSRRRADKYYNWRGGEIDADDVVEAPWRGKRYWQRYPEAQLEALNRLVPALCDRFGIDRDCAPEDRERTDLQRWKGFLGVISHYHIRADKTDVEPGLPLGRPHGRRRGHA